MIQSCAICHNYPEPKLSVSGIFLAPKQCQWCNFQSHRHRARNITTRLQKLLNGITDSIEKDYKFLFRLQLVCFRSEKRNVDGRTYNQKISLKFSFSFHNLLIAHRLIQKITIETDNYSEPKLLVSGICLAPKQSQWCNFQSHRHRTGNITTRLQKLLSGITDSAEKDYKFLFRLQLVWFCSERMNVYGRTYK